MSRYRRIQLRVIALQSLVCAAVGYAVEGIVFAAFLVAFILVVGYLTVRFVPEIRPPPPESVPRPAVGQSAIAVSRRRSDGIAMVALGLPMALLAGVLAVVAPPGAPRVAAIAFAAAALLWYGAWFVAATFGGERLDRWRLRRYDRTVEMLRAEREAYDRRVDPAADRAKRERLIRLAHLFLALHLAGLLIVLTGLVGMAWPPAGIALAVTLLAAAVAWFARRRARRP